MQVISVEEFLAEMTAKKMVVFDVRSPAEFTRGSIPGAHSLPLFDDAERAAVGLTYHQRGRADAIKLGLDLVGPKLRDFIERVEAAWQPNQQVGLYCWRGGCGVQQWLGYSIFTALRSSSSAVGIKPSAD